MTKAEEIKQEWETLKNLANSYKGKISDGELSDLTHLVEHYQKKADIPAQNWDSQERSKKEAIRKNQPAKVQEYERKQVEYSEQLKTFTEIKERLAQKLTYMDKILTELSALKNSVESLKETSQSIKQQSTATTSNNCACDNSKLEKTVEELKEKVNNIFPIDFNPIYNKIDGIKLPSVSTDLTPINNKVDTITELIKAQEIKKELDKVDINKLTGGERELVSKAKEKRETELLQDLIKSTLKADREVFFRTLKSNEKINRRIRLNNFYLDPEEFKKNFETKHKDRQISGWRGNCAIPWQLKNGTWIILFNQPTDKDGEYFRFISSNGLGVEREEGDEILSFCQQFYPNFQFNYENSGHTNMTWNNIAWQPNIFNSKLFVFRYIEYTVSSWDKELPNNNVWVWNDLQNHNNFKDRLETELKKHGN